ncbi:hypothetical protein GI374_03715 [Paracoccus sp. S-4012]|uniref:hypothetical protein n=1 Tax=Paracoccus sp. S-4012 TaxID=2665648 RepID=UPI0012AEE8CB|nr:hypothetical protein [Paracoccus sp. S-4012]MRX49565.1 hypothetical protein [Paracoccus sp. S-4012]
MIFQPAAETAPQGAEQTPLLAGFECARLHWNGHDLLHSTGHLPTGAMAHHYAVAAAEGAAGARDGLSWRHDIVERVRAAPERFPVMWDFVHFDAPPRPAQHAIACCLALPEGAWAIAVNEPSVGRRVSGLTPKRATDMALKMMTTAACLPLRPRFATCDPFHHLHPSVFTATDRLVASGHVEMVGVNYYPHHAHEPLHRVLRAVADRYRLPVMITETGWHDGLPAAHRRFPHVRDRWDWLAHVRAEIARSEVPVAGLCWYPWLDMPAWDNPAHGRWPCGWPGRQG